MAAFPSYVSFAWQGAGEKPESIVDRVEMDRGPAKQHRAQSDVMVQQQLTAYFHTKADADAFIGWFYAADGANGGAAFFDFTSLRTGGTVSARVVNGDIGALLPSTRTWARSERALTIEWLQVNA